MCGILGLLARDRWNCGAVDLQAALRSMRHRGPDDEGYLLYDPARSEALALGGADTVPGLGLPPVAASDPTRFRCAFGHRRLSILDLSAAGHQPMATQDGRYWVTYNGEIYNYLELRRELEGRGVRFRTSSDTEVLLEAYRAWGVGMLPRLVGMFAFALLDTRDNTVLLARDQFGIKPLYLARSERQLAFASEVKALLRLPGVRRRGNPSKVYQYVRYGVRDADAATVLEDVERLPAAHYLRVRLDSLETDGPHCYWKIDLKKRISPTFPEAVAEVRRMFDESVRLHLRSDVPIGATLSGGLDSSAIVRQVQSLLGPAQPLQHVLVRVRPRPGVQRGTVHGPHHGHRGAQGPAAGSGHRRRHRRGDARARVAVREPEHVRAVPGLPAGARSRHEGHPGRAGQRRDIRGLLLADRCADHGAAVAVEAAIGGSSVVRRAVQRPRVQGAHDGDGGRTAAARLAAADRGGALRGAAVSGLAARPTGSRREASAPGCARMAAGATRCARSSSSGSST